ncbi:hypothetical protein ACFWM5_28890 [Streptomyces bobili]|uniref:hypothetical protein n=1 Tax=Streptomyces bobili TaxID=67280 RepID=UPI00365BB70A
MAIGRTEQAADILQRTGGFLSAPRPRGDYHRLPHGLPIEQQRLKATTASHALLAAGHSVHLDPTLNMLATPDGKRDAALRYLTQLASEPRPPRPAARWPRSSPRSLRPCTGYCP